MNVYTFMRGMKRLNRENMLPTTEMPSTGGYNSKVESESLNRNVRSNFLHEIAGAANSFPRVEVGTTIFDRSMAVQLISIKHRQLRSISHGVMFGANMLRWKAHSRAVLFCTVRQVKTVGNQGAQG